MEPSHTIRPAFDDPNVVPDAGVVPPLRLGEPAGLYDLRPTRLITLTDVDPGSSKAQQPLDFGLLFAGVEVDVQAVLARLGPGRVIVGYGFREMGLHRIQLGVAPFNPAGIRAYEKAGFAEEGRYRESVLHDGRWYRSAWLRGRTMRTRGVRASRRLR